MWYCTPSCSGRVAPDVQVVTFSRGGAFARRVASPPFRTSPQDAVRAAGRRGRGASRSTAGGWNPRVRGERHDGAPPSEAPKRKLRAHSPRSKRNPESSVVSLFFAPCYLDLCSAGPSPPPPNLPRSRRAGKPALKGTKGPVSLPNTPPAKAESSVKLAQRFEDGDRPLL